MSDSETSINHNKFIKNINKNPRLLAYAQIFGTFEFNAKPMEPLGTKIIAHKKSAQRETWRKHRVSGWYIGSALEQYR